MLDALERLLPFAGTTLRLTGTAVVLGTFIMIVGGVSALSERRWVRWITTVYVEVFRGLAALILLYIAYYALPQAFGVQLSQMTAGVLALGTNMGAYGTEIARGAINAIPEGQGEAGIAINLTRTQRYRYIILPQAVITMLPPYGNLIIEVLKASALVAAIGMTDIMRGALNMRTLPGADSEAIFTAALLLYFLISMAVVGATRVAERLASRGRDLGLGAR